MFSNKLTNETFSAGLIGALTLIDVESKAVATPAPKTSLRASATRPLVLKSP